MTQASHIAIEEAHGMVVHQRVHHTCKPVDDDLPAAAVRANINNHNQDENGR